MRAADARGAAGPAVLPWTAPHPLRRSASGLAAAALAAVAAALTVGGGGSSASQQHSGSGRADRLPQSGPMIVVVAAQSGPAPTSVEVPRLRVQSVSVADLPVHGKFSDPVSL